MATWILAGAAALTLLFVIIAFVYRNVRDNQINQAFVKSMATNHLPHIHTCLTTIAGHMNIEIPEPPPIDFIDLSK